MKTHTKMIVTAVATLGLVAAAYGTNHYGPPDHVIAVEQLPSITIVGHRAAQTVEQLQPITIIGHRVNTVASNSRGAAQPNA